VAVNKALPFDVSLQVDQSTGALGQRRISLGRARARRPWAGINLTLLIVGSICLFFSIAQDRPPDNESVKKFTVCSCQWSVESHPILLPAKALSDTWFLIRSRPLSSASHSYLSGGYKAWRTTVLSGVRPPTSTRRFRPQALACARRRRGVSPRLYRWPARVRRRSLAVECRSDPHP